MQNDEVFPLGICRVYFQLHKETIIIQNFKKKSVVAKQYYNPGTDLAVFSRGILPNIFLHFTLILGMIEEKYL